MMEVETCPSETWGPIQVRSTRLCRPSSCVTEDGTAGTEYIVPSTLDFARFAGFGKPTQIQEPTPRSRLLPSLYSFLAAKKLHCKDF